MFNPIFKLQHQNYVVTESLYVWFKLKKSGHKNPNNIHNYHDENELYQGITKRNT